MKKLLALVLALTTVLGLLAGCGAKENTAETTTEDTANTETNNAPETTEETAATGTEETTDDSSGAVVVDLTILKEADESMLNTYSMIAVNPEAPFTDADGNAVSDVTINTAGADALMHWLLLPETLDLAANYGMEEYGNTLF